MTTSKPIAETADYFVRVGMYPVGEYEENVYEIVNKSYDVVETRGSFLPLVLKSIQDLQTALDEARGGSSEQH